VQTGREDPVRDRLAAARLHDHGHFGGRREGHRRLPDIPPEFTIILSTGDPRQCRLAWRIGCEFGAQFVD
jgi:hypothetical protein